MVEEKADYLSTMLQARTLEAMLKTFIEGIEEK